ncbi:hypothetical protein T10_10220 [Trichinella papuae]|uniref:Uncharacterized protein n=1 Tax=Trichinella papuae TaxID=268474 RepID=A0A0V1M3U3_9BILA|nr:hypothetical protein T10_10220 [Trichinella papuae]
MSAARVTRPCSRANLYSKAICSERNNTDPVGVTWPRAGDQKSRVGREQYPRTVGQIAIWAFWRQRAGVREAPCCARLTVAHQRIRPFSSLIGIRQGFRSAPELASAPAASELPIGGACGSTAGPLTLALYIGPEIVPKVVVDSHDRVIGVRKYWLAVFAISGRGELEVLDEPSRSAYGRTIERETLGTTVVARVRTLRALAVVAYRGSGDSEPENVSEGDRRRLELWYPGRSLRRERLHQIHFILCSPLAFGLTSERRMWRTRSLCDSACFLSRLRRKFDQLVDP